MRRRWSRPQPGDHDHAVDRLPCETARTAVGGEYHAGGQGTSLKSKAVMARSNHDLALPPSESLPQIGPPKSHHRCPCIDPARNIFGIGSFIREFFCAPPRAAGSRSRSTPTRRRRWVPAKRLGGRPGSAARPWRSRAASKADPGVRRAHLFSGLALSIVRPDPISKLDADRRQVLHIFP